MGSAVSSSCLFAIMIFFLLFVLPLDVSAAELNVTAHDELSSRGFPMGLLPDTVVSYTLETDGRFKVHLDGSCRFTIPNKNYPASYASSITGVLSYGAIKELDGINVKAFYKWWSITGIHIKNADLVFEVGLVTVNYPAYNFDESPICEGRKAQSLHSKS
eukprot:c18677_g1_i1 orf=212-691(+)